MSRYRFPGLRSFEENDAAIFNGRSKETQQLFDLIMVERVVVMFAKSGAGKTSLLRAGIVPMLADLPYEPVFIRLNHRETPLQEQVFGQIAQVFGISARPEQTLWEYLHDINTQTGNITPVLFFDQFEEVFTLYEDKMAEREALFIQLADLINAALPATVRRRLLEQRDQFPAGQLVSLEKPPRVKIVFSIRSDRLSDLHELSGKIPGILRNRFELRGLQPEQAIQAIVRPAAAPGSDYVCPPFQIAPDALQEIVDSLVSGRESKTKDTPEIESFQLQLVCRYLEEKMLDQHQKRIKPLVIRRETFGGKAGIGRLLSDFYADSLGAISDNTQRNNAQITIEEELIKNNARVSVAEASLLEGKYAVSNSTLQLLVEKRLLRREVRPGLGNYYELAHDTLLAPILTFRRERKIRESAELRSKKFDRIARIAVSFGIGILGLFLAFRAQESRAKVNLLIAQSVTQARQYPVRAFRLAEAAHKSAPDNIKALGSMIHAYYSNLFQSGDALYAAPPYQDYAARWAKPVPGSNKILAQAPGARNLLVIEPSKGKDSIKNIILPESIQDAALSPDGRWLVAVDSSGRVRLHSRANGKIVQTQNLQDTAFSVAIAANGKCFTTKGKNGVQRLWASNGTLLHTFINSAGVDLVYAQATFSPDGRQLLVLENDSTASLHQLDADNKPVKKIITVKARGTVSNAAFSPNGRYLSLFSVLDNEKTYIYLFDNKKNNLLQNNYENTVFEFTIVNDSAQMLLGASGSDTVYIIDQQRIFRRIIAYEIDAPNTVAVFSPDGTKAAYSSDNYQVLIRDLKDGAIVNTLSHDEQVNSLFYTTDQRYLVVKTTGNKIRIWGLMEHPVDQIRIESPVNAFFIPSTAAIAAQDINYAWKLGFLNGKHPLGWLNESVQFVVPWDKQAAVLLQDSSGVLRIVYAHNEKEDVIAGLPVADNFPVVGGKMIALNVADTVKVLQADGKEVTALSFVNRSVNNMALSSDDRFIALALSDSSIMVRSLSDSQPLTHRFSGSVQTVAFSPDCKWLLIGTAGKVYRWDLENPSPSPIPFLSNQHDADARVTAITFSPDKQFIATAGSDLNVILWSAKGDWLHTFSLPSGFGSASSLQFSQDSHYLLSRHFNYAVFRWSLDPNTLIEGMRHAEKLSEDEIRRYHLGKNSLFNF